MANWCTTELKFVPNWDSSECKNAVKDMYERISKHLDNKTEHCPSDFGASWLGNILIVFNVLSMDTSINDYPSMNDILGSALSNNTITMPFTFRGSITDIDFDGDGYVLSISQCDAWEPNLELWREIIRLNYTDKDGEPLIDIYFAAEEPGGEIYVTNDESGQYLSNECYIYIDIDLADIDSPFNIKNIDGEVTFDEDILKKYSHIITIHNNDGDGITFTIDEYFDNEENVVEFLNDIFKEKKSTLDAYIRYLSNTEYFVDIDWYIKPFNDIVDIEDYC